MNKTRLLTSWKLPIQLLLSSFSEKVASDFCRKVATGGCARSTCLIPPESPLTYEYLLLLVRIIAILPPLLRRCERTMPYHSLTT